MGTGGEQEMNMDEVYRKHAETVFRFMMTLCHEEETARELTQETFYQAIRSSGRYDGTCKVSTWLCQIAKHLWYREIVIREEKMELFRKVHLLDETSKEVVLLRITGEFSFREIGEIFGKQENWARVTFYRAKQKLVKGREES